MDCLRHADPKVRRRAAEALGRMKVAEAIEPLLESAPSMQSRALEHAVVQALVQLDADSETLVDVVTSSDKPQAKRIALLALSQLNDSEQVAALVGESLFAEASTVRDAALWISGFHPEWGETLAAVMRQKAKCHELIPGSRRAVLTGTAGAMQTTGYSPIHSSVARRMAGRRSGTFSSVDGLDSRYHGPGKTSKNAACLGGCGIAVSCALRAPGVETIHDSGLDDRLEA